MLKNELTTSTLSVTSLESDCRAGREGGYR